MFLSKQQKNTVFDELRLQMNVNRNSEWENYIPLLNQLYGTKISDTDSLLLAWKDSVSKAIPKLRPNQDCVIDGMFRTCSRQNKETHRIDLICLIDFARFPASDIADKTLLQKHVDTLHEYYTRAGWEWGSPDASKGFIPTKDELSRSIRDLHAMNGEGGCGGLHITHGQLAFTATFTDVYRLQMHPELTSLDF